MSYYRYANPKKGQIKVPQTPNLTGLNEQEREQVIEQWYDHLDRLAEDYIMSQENE